MSSTGVQVYELFKKHLTEHDFHFESHDDDMVITLTVHGQDLPRPTIIDVDDRIFTCSDNFFWLEPGESKDITINTTKGSLGENGPFKIIVNSWNAKSTILPIK